MTTVGSLLYGQYCTIIFFSQELKREVSRLNNAQNAAARQLDESGMSRVMDKYFGHNQTCLQRLEDTIKTTVFTMVILLYCNYLI